MKNHIIVLTIDLDAIARAAVTALQYASLPFLWLYYTIADLVDAIAFYAPYAWRSIKRKSKVIKRYLVLIARYAKDKLIQICDFLIYSGLFISFLIVAAYQKYIIWFSDAWAFRAAILAEC